MAGRKLRLAMAGGGEGAFIGGVHRMAAALDGEWELVAGTFSSDAARNRRSGEQLGLSPDRVHDSIDALLADVQLLRSVRAPVACLRSRRLRLRRRARTGAAADMC